jgi:hypothetical protein
VTPSNSIWQCAILCLATRPEEGRKAPRYGVSTTSALQNPAFPVLSWPAESAGNIQRNPSTTPCPSCPPPNDISQSCLERATNGSVSLIFQTETARGRVTRPQPDPRASKYPQTGSQMNLSMEIRRSSLIPVPGDQITVIICHATQGVAGLPAQQSFLGALLYVPYCRCSKRGTKRHKEDKRHKEHKLAQDIVINQRTRSQPSFPHEQ